MDTPGEFAGWVAPLARQLAADRAAVIAFARSADPACWSEPVSGGGWTRKDILAHLAGGNDMMVQQVLRAVIGGTPVGAALLTPDTEEANRRGVAERRDWPVERLVAELERGGAEMQELLAALADHHRDERLGDGSYTLGALLRLVLHERHDHEHLEQLRPGA